MGKWLKSCSLALGIERASPALQGLVRSTEALAKPCKARPFAL
ncbi:MAG: hypothetical protein NZ551_05905 [Microscillaceae bacterium]|nr:hypothetical protein [Microscillaceae bacterium]MDW8460727.1 hypothetical protein [Cytophagales bacterium]